MIGSAALSSLPRRGPAWCRIGRRLAAGHRPAHVARAERLAPEALARLLAEPDFTALVAAYRKLDALPLEQQLERLEKLALLVIENALNAGNWRVAVFVLGERRAGRNPARRIAQGIVAAGRRAAKSPTEPCPSVAQPPAPATARRPCPPADPAAGVEARTRAGLRVAVAAELTWEERAAEDAAAADAAGGTAADKVEPKAAARLSVVRRPLPTPDPLAAFASPACDITPAAPQPPRRGLPRRPGTP